MQDVDQVLTSFLHAKNEADRERLIDELILIHAVPIIRLVLRRQLGFYISQSGVNVNNPEAADLFNEVITKILQRLRGLQSQSAGDEIRDFSGYVNRTATNACYDYLRKKHFARYSLKNRIRYLFIEHQDFRIWKIGKKISLCGFAKWAGRKDAESVMRDECEYVSEQIKAKGLANENLQEAQLAKIVSQIFSLVGRPIELEHLVDIVAKMLNTHRHIPESLDDANSQLARRLESPDVGAELHLQGRDILEQLWREIMRLPPIQRKIIFLSRVDEMDDDFWSLLLEANVVTISQLADEMGISLDQFMELWKQVPMDVAGVAAYLGLTRQQVIKWKYYARQQLRRHLSET